MPKRPPRRESRVRPAGSERKQRSAGAWYHHLTWTGALGTCVALVVLIGAAFGVRQVLIIVRQRAEDAQRAEQPSDHRAPETPVVEAAPPPSPVPAAADRTPGRSFQTVLTVGPGAGMFPSLTAAWAEVVPGDVIEFHTNEPQIIEEQLSVPEGGTSDAPLTFRAGEGFQPVIVAREDRSGFTLFTERHDFQFEELHFVVPPYASLVGTAGCNVSFHDCTFTTMDAPRMNAGNAVGMFAREQSPSTPRPEVVFERCLARGVLPFVNHEAAAASPIVRLERCAGIFGGTAMAGEPFTLEVVRSTLVATQLALMNSRPLEYQPPSSFRFRIVESLVVPTIVPAWGRTLLVELRIDVPQGTTRESLQPFELLRRHVAEAEMSANIFGSSKPEWTAILSYRDGRSLDELFGTFETPVLGPVPTFDATLELGPRITAFQSAPDDEKNTIAASTVPGDFQVRNSDALRRLVQAGRMYGCPIEELPTPPASIAGLIP